jgi:glutamine amidotransferase
MGWNSVAARQGAALFQGLPDQVHMYFTHSFAVRAAREAHITAKTDHGGWFCAAVTRDNVAGVQFHPEKSQGAGVALLTNFLEWRP